MFVLLFRIMGLKIKIKKPKVIKKVATKVKSTAKKVGSIIADKAQDVPFQPLLPLKPVMMAALKLKGLSTSGSIREVALRFYDNIVKRNNFDEGSLDDRYPTISEPVYQNYTDPDNFDPATVTAIVSAIIGYVKKVKEKKAAGEKLTKTQEAVNRVTDEVEQRYDEAKTEAVRDEVGGAVLNIADFIEKYWWAILGAGALGYMAYKSTGKSK